MRNGDVMSIVIDGAIGAGKSKQGKMLKAHGYPFVAEPSYQLKWKVAQRLFYADMRRWGYFFQTVAFGLRAQAWREIVDGLYGDPAVVVAERSVWTDKLVFARMLYQDTLMCEVEYEAYLNLWLELPHSSLARPSAVVYLDVTPEVALERIAKRGREDEKSITAGYLESLDRAHRRYLGEMERDGVVVEVVDANRGVEAVFEDVLGFVNQHVEELRNQFSSGVRPACGARWSHGD